MNAFSYTYTVHFPALREKRQEVVGKLKSLQAETDVITKIFEEPEVQRQIQSSRLVLA